MIGKQKNGNELNQFKSASKAQNVTMDQIETIDIENSPSRREVIKENSGQKRQLLAISDYDYDAGLIEDEFSSQIDSTDQIEKNQENSRREPTKEKYEVAQKRQMVTSNYENSQNDIMSRSQVVKQKIDSELTEIESTMKLPRSQTSERVFSVSLLQGQRQIIMNKLLETQNRLVGLLENEQEIAKMNINRNYE